MRLYEINEIPSNTRYFVHVEFVMLFLWDSTEANFFSLPENGENVFVSPFLRTDIRWTIKIDNRIPAKPVDYSKLTEFISEGSGLTSFMSNLYKLNSV